MEPSSYYRSTILWAGIGVYIIAPRKYGGGSKPYYQGPYPGRARRSAATAA